MRSEYPLGQVGKAFQSTVGWAGVALATMFAGIWLGMWIGEGDLPGLDSAVDGFLGAFIGWLIFPRRIIAAFFVTFFVFYLPLKFESIRLYIGAAVVNLLTWTVVVASILLDFHIQ